MALRCEGEARVVIVDLPEHGLHDSLLIARPLLAAIRRSDILETSMNHAELADVRKVVDDVMAAIVTAAVEGTRCPCPVSASSR